VGVRLHNDWIERMHTEAPHLMRGGRLVREDSAATPSAENRGEVWALAVYALDQVSFGDVTLTPGLRFEWIGSTLTDRLAGGVVTEHTQAVFVPGFGAHYALTPALGVLAGVHRGFTPVSPGQPQEVKPETSVNYEAGVRYSAPEARSLAEVIGFWNDYSNLTGNCGFSSGCSEAQLDRQFNAGRVWVYGVEVVGAHTWAAGPVRFPTRLSYTFTASSFRDSFASDDPQLGDVQEGDALPYVPTHQAALQAGVEWASIRGNVGFTYVSAAREQAGSGDADPMTDPQYLLDALVGYTLFDHFELYLRGDNLLNAAPLGSRRPFGARPIRPFMGQAGLRITYE
jgi:Fe(3+) dicitrate transport protein